MKVKPKNLYGCIKVTAGSQIRMEKMENKEETQIKNK